MQKVYNVKQGDCLASIAERFGFLPRTIWDHPDNAELKRTHGNAMTLSEGDVIKIPNMEHKEESVETEKRHRFRRRDIPAKLCLQFYEEGEPRVNTPCLVNIDGHSEKCSTDKEGRLEIFIPSGAKKGWIQIGECEETMQYDLNLGYLDPYNSTKGMQQRLRNLGLFDGEVTGIRDEPTENALVRFCELHDLQLESMDEPQLFEKVREAHGA